MPKNVESAEVVKNGLVQDTMHMANGLMVIVEASMNAINESAIDVSTKDGDEMKENPVNELAMDKDPVKSVGMEEDPVHKPAVIHNVRVSRHRQVIEYPQIHMRASYQMGRFGEMNEIKANLTRTRT